MSKLLEEKRNSKNSKSIRTDGRKKGGELTKIFLKLETWKTLNKPTEIYPVILVITVYVNGLSFSY